MCTCIRVAEEDVVSLGAGDKDSCEFTGVGGWETNTGLPIIQ